MFLGIIWVCELYKVYFLDLELAVSYVILVDWLVFVQTASREFLVSVAPLSELKRLRHCSNIQTFLYYLYLETLPG